MFIIKIVFKYNSYTGVITQRQQFPVEVERSDVRRQSREQPVTSAPLAQLALDRYCEPGTAFRYADQKPYFARHAASLPCSLFNVLGDLHISFFTCMFHPASFILIPSLFVLIPAPSNLVQLWFSTLPCFLSLALHFYNFTWQQD